MVVHLSPVLLES